MLVVLREARERGAIHVLETGVFRLDRGGACEFADGFVDPLQA